MLPPTHIPPPPYTEEEGEEEYQGEDREQEEVGGATGMEYEEPDQVEYAQPSATPWAAEEPPLTRAEVYRSLSGCYEECNKQVQGVSGQIS